MSRYAAPMLSTARYVRPCDLQEGDRVYVLDDLSELRMEQAETPQRVKKQGLYTPITMEGTIIVDGVAVSCYASAWLKSVWWFHLAMLPLRVAQRACPSRRSLELHWGKRNKGAHIYIELLSLLTPIMKKLAV